MIKVSRRRKDDNGQIIRPPLTWFELAKRKTSQAIQDGANHKADSSAYAHDDLRAALERLFNGKCAYCEQKLGEQWDVDHFRPKGRLFDRHDHQGYYWLVYKWENLYPSCANCNRWLRDKPLYDDPCVGPPAGKWNQFPLSDERTRAMNPSMSLSDERRFLIDPCRDEPSKHLTFRTNGQIVPVRRSRLGSKTIKVLNLRRKRLRKDRRKIIRRTVEFQRTVNELRAKIGVSPARAVEDLTKTALLDDECVHLAVARAVLARPEDFGV